MPPYSHRYWPSATVRGWECIIQSYPEQRRAKAELGPTQREGQQLRLGSELHLPERRKARDCERQPQMLADASWREISGKRILQGGAEGPPFGSGFSQEVQ